MCHTTLWAQLLLLIALAFPVEADLSNHMLIPDAADSVALDPVNKRLIAFDADGGHLGHYHMNASLPMKRERLDYNCYPMTEEDLKQLPNLSKLEDHVHRYFDSEVNYKIVVNDQDINTKHRTAEICASNNGARVILEQFADDKCKTLLYSMDAAPLKDGNIHLRSVTDVRSFPPLTVTSDPRFAIGKTFNTIPLHIGHMKRPKHIRTDLMIQFQNKKGESVPVEHGIPLRQHVTLNKDRNPNCTISYLEENCPVAGTGELGLLARGWIWFEYDDRVGKTKDNRHWKWAFKMNGIIPQKDRTLFTKFKLRGDFLFTNPFTKEGCSDKDFAVPWPGETKRY